MKTVNKLLSELRQQEVKLWLDGDKLRYRASKEHLNAELLTQLKNQKSEIVEFLRSIAEQHQSSTPPLVPVDRSEDLPLSFGQQRLWFLHQFEPNSSANNVPVVVRFTGDLNVPALEQSLQAVVARHEILRTTFPAIHGKPTQSIEPNLKISLPIVDLQHLPPAEREAESFRLTTQSAHQPFDLEQGPMLRLLLMRLSDREHLLLWNMHNILCDGASSDIFYQDTIAYYRAFAGGETPALPPLPIQYADFAIWQRAWLQGEVLAKQVDYWQRKLEGNLPTIRLPFDRPRPRGKTTYRGDRAARMLPAALNTTLTNLSQSWGGTQFMTLLTAFNVLLHRYSAQEDLIVSFASTGRGQPELERSIGFFSNTLIQRTNLSGNPTFRELFDRVRQDCIDAYNHQDLPFEKLVEELKPEQRQDRSPLFQVKFALNPPWSKGRGMGVVELPDLTIASLFGYIYHGQTKYDLILVMREQDEGLGMVFDYNAEIFEAQTIDRMLGHMQTLLEGIIANPDRPISELPPFESIASSKDLQLLSIPAEPKIDSEKIFAPADNPLQIQLTKIWENTLGIPSIGLTDNFFDLGGNSLIAVRLFAQIERVFNKNLPLSILFQAPTIERLADILSQEGCATAWSALVPIQPHGHKPPLFLMHSIGGNVLEYSTLAHYLGREQPVYGLQSLGLDGKQAPLETVPEMAARYVQEIRTIQPEGPYFLAGYSFGGLVAIEIARQLELQFQQVGLLGLLDTRFPNLQTTRPSISKFIRVHLTNLWQLQPQERSSYLKNWFQWYSSNQNLDELLINNWYEIVEDPHIINTIENNVRAYNNYVPEFYPRSATLFRSSVQPVRSADIMDLGWSKLFGGDLEIQHLPGEHYGLLKEPNVRVLAQKLQSYLG